MSATRLPAEPLLRQVELAGGDIVVCPQRHGPTKRALRKAREQGTLTVTQADRLSVELLGLHPAALWGDAFYS